MSFFVKHDEAESLDVAFKQEFCEVFVELQGFMICFSSKNTSGRTFLL